MFIPGLPDIKISYSVSLSQLLLFLNNHSSYALMNFVLHRKCVGKQTLLAVYWTLLIIERGFLPRAKIKEDKR